MKLSQDSLLGLKRHFLGALSEPSPVWLCPAPGPRLLLASRGALRNGSNGCAVDFGTVDSPGEERRTLRVVSLGEETLTLKIQNPPSWLAASWHGATGDTVHLAADESSELELVAAHDFLEEKSLAGPVELLAETLGGESLASEILVRLATRRTRPVGQYDFQGFAEPRSFDFGRLDPAASGPEVLQSYAVSFRNLTSVPLNVSFADLPPWLVFEVDGYQRRGPAVGRFFERTAPFQAQIRPIRSFEFLGLQHGRLNLWTNDSRPHLQQIAIELSADIESAKPYVTVEAPEPVRVSTAEPCWVEARLVNWGKSSSRLSLKGLSPVLQIEGRPTVPGAKDGEPGRATLRIRIVSEKLPTGSHPLTLTLRVEDGEPAEIVVPVWVSVVQPDVPQELHSDVQPSRSIQPVTVLTVLLFLLLMIVFVAIFRDVLPG